MNKNEKSKEELLLELQELKNSYQILQVQNQNLQRKLANEESELSNLNSRFELMMKSSNVAWWELSIHSGKMDFSPNKVEILGFKPESFNFSIDFKNLLHIDDYEQVMQEMLDHISGIIDYYDVIYRLKDKTGEYKYFHDIGKISKWSDKGEPVLISGITFDIDEKIFIDEALRSSEKLLKQAEEIGKFGNWQLDLKTGIITASDGAKRIYGIDDNKITLELVQLLSQKKFRAMLDKAMSDTLNLGLPYDTKYCINRANDGEEVCIHSNAQYMPDENILFGTIKDITQLNKLNKSLESSNEKVRAIFDSFPLGITICNKEGQIIDFNKKAEFLLGLSLKELSKTRIGELKLKIINQQGLDFLNDEFPSIRALKENRLIENVVMGIVTDNKTTWLNVTAAPMQIDGLGAINAYSDITDRINSEKALRISESNLELAQRMAKIGSWSWDLVNNKVQWSEELYRVFDIDKESYDGNPEFLLNKIHPDDLNSYMNSFNKNLEGGYSPALEYRIIHRDGSIHSVYAEGYIEYDKSGKAISNSGTAQDITERKIIEDELKDSKDKYKAISAQFEAILDQIPWLIYYKDKFNNFKIVNKYVADKYGMKKEDLEGANLADIHSIKEADIDHQDDLSIINSGISKLNIEEKWNTGDGDKWLNTSKIPFVDSKGEVIGIIGISVDITEIKESQLKLELLNNSLKELNATKDKFFSIIAHDLRNPLGNFKQITEMLYDNFNDFNKTELIEFLGLMKNSSNNIFSLLDNLLEWSRSQRGIIQFNPEYTNLYLLMENLLQFVKPLSVNKKIELINNVKRTTFVYIDVILLNIILRNLITNAIKFTNENGSVKINCCNSDNIEEIIISITDTGLGISQDRISNLFKIEDSNSTPGTRNEKGTGLGLILCKEFVEIHKGRIWVESEVGKGSTFFIALPIE